MNNSISNQQLQDTKPVKKGFYITEILMLKSIIVLLILTFFLLNELEASSLSPVKMNNQIEKANIETEKRLDL